MNYTAGIIRRHRKSIVLPLQRRGLRSWLHLRVPDGFVYELVEELTR